MSDVLSQVGEAAADRDGGSATEELTGLVAAALSAALGEPLDHGPAEQQGGLSDLLPVGEVRAVAATSNGATTHLVVVLAAPLADRLAPSTSEWLPLLDAPFADWGGRSSVAVERSLAVDGEGALVELLPQRRGLTLHAAGLFLGGEHVGSVATLGSDRPAEAPEAASPARYPDTTSPAPPPGDDAAAHDRTAHDGTAPAPRPPSPARHDGPIHFLADVELNVTAELGRCRMAVADLLGLSPGSVIELDRPAGGPIDLLVNGTLIARGEVVVIDEEFGVRITEIVGTED